MIINTSKKKQIVPKETIKKLLKLLKILNTKIF